MIPFGILADDLTGACDCGVQFSARGARVRVLLSSEHSPDGHSPRGQGEWDVTVVNTESRHASPRDAARKVREGINLLAEASAPLGYKKIDSTLRGNIADELRPLIQAGMTVVVCPAFPRLGRSVEGGHVLVKGIPVHESEVGRDPFDPVRESHLPTLLEGALNLGTGILSPEGGRDGQGALDDQVDRLLGSGARLLVADASTDEHLLSLGATLAQHSGSLVGVGSAGLAQALAKVVLGAKRSPPHPPEFVGTPIGSGRRAGNLVLVVAGSRHPATVAQLDSPALRERAVRFQCDPREFNVAWSREQRLAYCRKVEKEFSEAIKSGTTLLMISIAPDSTMDEVEEPMERVRLRSGRLNSILGELALHLGKSLPLAGLVLTGGDTARSVLNAFGASALQLGRELYPGIPLGWIDDPDWRGLPVVTKSGAFGEADVLSKLAAELAGSSLDDVQGKPGSGGPYR